MTIRNQSGDVFGMLFAAVGPALFSQPLRFPSPSIGGLLLDPTIAQLVAWRNLGLRTPWFVDFPFLFDPALLSISVHVQGLIVHQDALLRPVLLWTPALTFH